MIHMGTRSMRGGECIMAKAGQMQAQVEDMLAAKLEATEWTMARSVTKVFQ
jgi:hypothetical protein